VGPQLALGVGRQTGSVAPGRWAWIEGRVRRPERRPPAAAPRPAPAPPAPAAPRGAPSPPPGSAAGPHSGHTPGSRSRTPGGATGPKAIVSRIARPRPPACRPAPAAGRSPRAIGPAGRVRRGRRATAGAAGGRHLHNAPPAVPKLCEHGWTLPKATRVWPGCGPWAACPATGVPTTPDHIPRKAPRPLEHP
jgi:hypothetical protein